jgi:hypothetical protein
MVLMDSGGIAVAILKTMPNHISLSARFFTAATLVFAACGEVMVADREDKTLPSESASKVDVLFLVDNSGSMKPKQALLAQAFEQFTAALSSAGELPSLHIGVATTDMGTSGAGQALGCSDRGDNGALRVGSLTTNDGKNFLRDEPSSSTRARNYSGTLAAAFTEIANVGTVGCGFEQPLASVRAALTSPLNGDFLRKDAHLAIVVVSDEDDCSALPTLFSDKPELGLALSFRCTRFGVICDQDMTTSGAKTNCRPDESSVHVQKVSEFVKAIRKLKALPDSMITFATLSAPESPVETGTDPNPSSPGLSLLKSCTGPDAGGTLSGFPAVRLRAAAAAFPSNLSTSICDSNYGTALASIANEVRKAPQRAGCFLRPIQTPADCAVTDVSDAGQVALGQCDAGASAKPCWKVTSNNSACLTPLSGSAIEIVRAIPPAVGTVTQVSCAVD